MNARRLLLMGVLAVGLLAVALWYMGARRPTQQAGLDAPFAPGLAARLNEIEQVRIVAPGATTLATLQRNDDGWGLLERDGYPADAARLRSLLLGLAESRRVEAKTANPALHDRLGVEDIARDDAGGLQVEIDGGGEALAIVVGIGAARGSGSYLRHAGDPQAWQVDRAIEVERHAPNWLQRELTDIGVDRIERIEVQPPAGTPFAIVRSEDSAGDFRLEELPRGREQASDFVADATAGIVGSLRFDDVLAAGAVEPDPGSRQLTTFLLRDGLRIVIDAWQGDGRTLARFEAGVDEVRALAAIEHEQAQARAAWQARSRALDADTDPADGVDPSDGAQTPDADLAAPLDEIAPAAPGAVADPDGHRQRELERLQQEAAALQARFAGRVFVMPTFKAANITRDLEGYLKPKS
jgi:hypothetical protein